MLLLLLSHSQGGSGAHTFSHRMFLSGSGGQLTAVRTAVLNLKHDAEAAYGACIAAPDLDGLLVGDGAAAAAASSSSEAGGDGLPNAVRELEQLFERLVARLEAEGGPPG